MQYRIYAAEYKVALIKEYQSGNISMRAFCKEKGISLSTFESWLRKIKMYGQSGLKLIPKTNNPLTPIDVTDETKMIVKEKEVESFGSFTLETKGMKLTFSIKNLKQVLEVINHD